MICAPESVWWQKKARHWWNVVFQQNAVSTMEILVTCMYTATLNIYDLNPLYVGTCVMQIHVLEHIFKFKIKHIPSLGGQYLQFLNNVVWRQLLKAILKRKKINKNRHACARQDVSNTETFFLAIMFIFHDLGEQRNVLTSIKYSWILTVMACVKSYILLWSNMLKMCSGCDVCLL